MGSIERSLSVRREKKQWNRTERHALVSRQEFV